jgi:hypothetical protein
MDTVIGYSVPVVTKVCSAMHHLGHQNENSVQSLETVATVSAAC